MDWYLLSIICALCLGWFATFRTLKTYRRENAALSNRVDLLHKAISASHAGIFFYNVVDNESRWDAASLRMFGLEGEERIIPPGAWESLLHPEDRERVLTKVIETLNSDSHLFNHTYRVLLPNNEVRWIEGTGFVIRDANLKPLEITGFHFDITKQVEYENSLKVSESKALKAMEAKAQFLANMSHEIRTPMNAIVGMIELLNFENPTPIQRRYIHTLQNSSDVLLRIINDILDVSKIEAGKLKLEQKSFNIRQVLGQCLTVYTQASEHKNLLLTGRIDPSVPLEIVGDSTRLQQVVMNLIGNAFKFTQSGQIVLRVVTEGEHSLRFTISDSGIGIAEDAVNTLFDRFNQADLSTTRKFGGTGLGLTIVKEIVELWHGRIKVTSRLGEGSNFSFVIPIKEPYRTLEKPAGKILLCSRFETLAKLWREDSSAPEMTWVQDVNSFQNAIVQQRFDQLIVEQRFHESKGPELIRWAKQKCPDIKATLVGYEKYVKEDQDLDVVDRYLPKPFLVNQLWDPCFTEAKSQKSSTSFTQWPDYSHLKVLCVDDNQSNLIVLSGLMKRFGIQVESADRGAIALERVAHQDFDLILMDYEMPEMDGPETTRQLMKMKPSLVIGLSAHTGEFFQRQAEDAGMRGFLRKPIKIAALAELLGYHFSVKPSAVDALPGTKAR